MDRQTSGHLKAKNAGYFSSSTEFYVNSWYNEGLFLSQEKYILCL